MIVKNIFVKPAADGLVVPDPDTHRSLKAEGEWKPETMYWVRRLRDGDVVEATGPVERKEIAEASIAEEAPAPRSRASKS